MSISPARSRRCTYAYNLKYSAFKGTLKAADSASLFGFILKSRHPRFRFHRGETDAAVRRLAAVSSRASASDNDALRLFDKTGTRATTSPNGSARIWDNAVGRSQGRGFTFSEGGQWLCLGLWTRTARLTNKAAVAEDSGALCRFPPITHIPPASPAVVRPPAARNTQLTPGPIHIPTGAG